MKKKKLIFCLAALLLTTSLFMITACDFGNTSTGDSSDTTTSSNTQTFPSPNIPLDPVTLTIRTETAKITDSGRAGQKMDKVLLSNYFNVKSAYNAGYTKLHITYTFDVRELDDGYQYVFFYADTNCKGNNFLDKIIDEVYDPQDPSLLYEYRLEHGGSKKNTKWGTHTFSTTIKMSRLKDDLYIRYGASGKYDDDWENKNVVVTFQVAR